MVRQIGTAAPLYKNCRPPLPAGFATHAMSGSNQIVSEQRRRGALSYAGKFNVL